MQTNGFRQFIRMYGPALIIGAGVVCLLIALFFPVPGGHLTTYKSLANDSGNSYIEEYVGGDAYNYIIGASLIGGHIAGAMATKSLFAVGGLILLAMGIMSIAKSPAAEAEAPLGKADAAHTSPSAEKESGTPASFENDANSRPQSGSSIKADSNELGTKTEELSR